MPRKNNSIKAFSAELNSIIHLKRLTERQGKILFNKLSRFIKKSASGEFDFVKYVQIVITDAVTTDEKKTFASRMEEATKVKDAVQDPLLEYKLLGAYYSAIVEFYPDFRIEGVRSIIRTYKDMGRKMLMSQDAGLMNSYIQDRVNAGMVLQGGEPLFELNLR